MRFFFFLFLLCLALNTALAASGFSWSQAEKSVTSARFPDAAGVLLHDVESITYQPDGTSVETDDFYQKILTEKGKREAQVLQMRYCTSYGTAQFLKAEILRPGCSPRQVDIKQYSAIAVDPEQMGSNIYDPSWKVLKLTLPDLQVGDTIHIVTRQVTTKARIPGVWSSYIPLQSTDPILHYEVRISAPAELPLKSIALKDKLPDTVSFKEEKQGNRILYTWQAINIPQIFPEPGMPAWYTCVQRLLVSTAPDWASISRWYYQLCRPRMDAVSPEMKEEVAKLIRGAQTPEEKLRRIFRFVSQEIRYMGLTTEETAPGYEPHDVKDTFSKRYGVCRDKAVLLAAMLELAGIKAYPVLFMAGDPKDPEVPNNYFNHAITAAELAPGKYTLMDPTYENTADLLPAGEAEMSYLVAKPEGETLRMSPAASPLRNRLALRTTGKALTDGTMKLRTILTFTGINDQMFRSAFARWSANTREQFFAMRLKQALPGVKLTGLRVQPAQIRNTAEKLQVTLDYTANWRMPPDRPEIQLQIPDFLQVFGFATAEVLDYTGLQKRQYPIKLYSCSDFESEFALQLPTGIEPVALPPPRQSFRSPAVNISRQVAFAGDTLTQKFRMQTVRTRLSVQDYDELKKILRQWEPASRIRCLFRAGGKIANAAAAFPEADALLTRSGKWTLHSASAGQHDLKMRIHVLNYAGVKRYSEVQIPFQPAWDLTPQIAGTVTSPDGKTVRKLSPSEINIMDQPWAGQAPRYPAGKILTANFPGVQPGSVIEYTLTQKFKDRPFIHMRHAFAAHEPLLQDNLSVHFPAGIHPVRLPLPPYTAYKDNHFVRKNVPAVPREPGQPALTGFVPSWGFSCGNWQQLAATLKTELDMRTNGQPAAEEKGRLLCADEEREVNKIAAIRNFVLKNIRLTGPAYTELPFRCLTGADRVLRDGYGNSADRAILLKTMLNAAGIPAEFIAVSNIQYTQKKMAELQKLPDAGVMQTILVAAGSEPEKYYLGGGTEYDALGSCPFENDLALDLQSGQLFELTVRQPGRDLVGRFDIVLHENGMADVTWTRRYYGASYGEAAKMFAEMTPEKRRRYEQQLVDQISSNAVQTRPMTTNFSRYPGVRQLTLRIPDFAVRTGSFRQMELPEFQNLYHLFQTAGSERKTPLERKTGSKLLLEYRILFPGNWQVFSTDDLESYSIHEQLLLRRRVSGNILHISASLEQRPGEILPLDYDNLEYLHGALGEQSFQTVVFSVLQKP